MPPFSRRAFLFASAGTLLAQDSTFITDVNVVTVLATVHDSGGRIVKDLTRDDFALSEDGVPQTIRYFSRESDLPLTVGLLIDTSRSQINVMEPERDASYKFLDQVLRPDKDQAFVAHFDTRVELLQGFTSSRQELRAALDQLEIPDEVATLLYQAIRLTSETMMLPRQGRKAFILLSDGVSFRDKASIETAIEYAQRADTIIYSILFAEHPKRHRPARAPIRAIVNSHGQRAMRRLARETGGAYFEISASPTIVDVYTRIEDELRNQYSLGYTPARSNKSTGYRKIKLTVKRPRLVVQSRDGYYAR